MEEKMTNVIEDTKNHIKWEQQFVDRITEDIKEYTQKSSPEDIAMFLPGKIRELDEAISRRQKYAEQLNMLQFIQKKTKGGKQS